MATINNTNAASHLVSTPEEHNFLTSCYIYLYEQAQRIYDIAIQVFNTLFCCCCSNTLSFDYRDEISNGLAAFSNCYVRGQVNGIYITTNETHLVETLATSGLHPPVRDAQTIHIGCATWHNFDIICARRSTYGLIVDFNPKNAEFIHRTMDFIRDSGTREAFRDAVIQYLHSLGGAMRNYFFHADQRENPVERIEREFLRMGGWLSTEENYQYMKNEIVGRNRLVPITEDIRNSEVFARIREFLDQKQISIDTVYMSNICNFMRSDHSQAAFTRSIRSLLHPATLFISCPTIRRGERQTILQQRTCMGAEVLSTGFNTSQLFSI